MARISNDKIINDPLNFSKLSSKYSEALEALSNKFKITNGDEFSKLINFKRNKSIPKHNWYKYSQGYASELVEKIILNEVPGERDFILDPFCGVGTTNLSAQKLGYKSIGFDINPVAILAALTKTHYYSNFELNQISSFLSRFEPTGESSILEQPKVLKTSFRDDVLKKLYKIKYFWETMDCSNAVRNFFRLAFISILEDCSLKIKDGNGLKLKSNKPYISDVYSHYRNKCDQMINDIKAANISKQCLFYNNSLIDDKALSYIADKRVALSIFSPPYANCFDYCEVYKLELWLGGFVEKYKDFANYRNMAMRSHVNSKFDHNFKFLDDDVDLIANLVGTFNIWNKNIPDMLRGYFDDMHSLLYRMKQVLVPNAKCFIVVANSGYKGVLVPTDLLISKIAERLGYRVNQIYHARKIRSSSQQMHELSLDYEGLMRESIIELQLV